MLGNLFEDDDSAVSDATAGSSSFCERDQPPRPRGASGLCGINNQGATCYLNSLIQTLVYTPEFRESLFCLGEDDLGCLKDKDKPGAKVRVIPIQLQRLFAQLLLSNRQSVSTEELTQSFGWTNNEQFQQHDVQESNRILFSAIESSLVGTTGKELVRHLYHGKLVNQIKCMECGFISEREEDFLDLSVTVAGSTGMEQSLHTQYCDVEMMTGNNQYRCSKCKKLVDASKGAKLRNLPAILSVSFLRFSFNYQRLERYKETGKFVFPYRVNMRAYCENPAEGEEMDYELFSVVIHGGGAHGGHYHAYIRDIDGLGKWVPPEEEEILIRSDPRSSNVDFIECESPLDLIQCVLGREKNKAMGMDKLCQEIVKQTGVSWNKRFKMKFGPIVKFVCKHEDKFIYDKEHNHVSLKVLGKNSCENADNLPGKGQTTPAGGHDNIKERGDSKKTERVSDGCCWFNFNDSRVHPIHEKEIEKQFSGRESAYMVFYRRKNMTRPEEARNNPAYRIPENLQTEVIIDNQNLEQQRKEFDIRVNQVVIQVHFSDQYQYIEGALKPHHTVPCWRELHIDKRKTTAQLFEAIREFGTELLPSNHFCVNRLKELAAGGHLYDPVPESEELNLSHFDIVNGSRLFVWDGKKVGGCSVPTGLETEPVFLTVIHGVDIQFSQGFPKSMTLLDIKVIICDRLKVRGQDLVMKQLVGKDSEVKAVAFSDSDKRKTITELRLADGDQLLAEDKRQKSSSVMGEDFKAKIVSSKMLVKVEDRVSVGTQDVFEGPVVTIEIDKDATVGELKTLAVSAFDIGEVPGGGRLRIDHDDLGLRPPIHEDLSIFEACINQNTLVVLQSGRPPLTDELTLWFTSTSVNSALKDSGTELVISKHATVLFCLECLLQRAQITDGSWYLRKTNWCGEAAEILDDMESTLEASLVNDGDHLLLEEGRLSPKGFIRVPIWLYPTPASVRMSSQNAGLLSWLASSFNAFIGKQTENIDAVRSDEVASKPVPFHLGEVEISREATLEDLKYQVLTLGSDLELPIPSHEFMRLRLVERNRLSSVLRGQDQTLKRMKLSSNSVLALQILPEEENLSQNQLVLSIRERISDTRCYKPSFDLVWDTTSGATLDSLTRIVSESLGIQQEAVCLAKHFQQRYEWIVIDNNQKQGNQKGKRKGSNNLKQGPYNIRDGDVIGVKDLRCDPNNLDDFTTQEDDIGKLELLQEAEEKRKMREERKKLKTDFGDWKKSHRPEVGITIKVGDFS